MFEYSAKVVRVVDGDTLDAEIDIGFDVFVKKRIRLYGIDTWESRTRDVEEKESEKDMTDIPEGKWMEDPISDGQKNFINTLVTQAIDAGLDELGAEAKSYLNSGEATKGNASAMIDKLKSALS